MESSNNNLLSLLIRGEEVIINLDDLFAEAGNVPQLEERLATCAQQLAILSAAGADKEQELETAKINLRWDQEDRYEEAQQYLTKQGNKNPTEKAIATWISTRYPENREKEQAIIDLTREFRILEGIIRAYKDFGFHLGVLLKTDLSGGVGAMASERSQEIARAEERWKQRAEQLQKIKDTASPAPAPDPEPDPEPPSPPAPPPIQPKAPVKPPAAAKPDKPAMSKVPEGKKPALRLKKGK